jgi:hypothetical protein
MTTLMKASNQWASRPADERFSSLTDLHAVALRDRERAMKSNPPTAALRVVADEGSIYLAGKQPGAKASMTNWAFSQLAAHAEAPASYLRKLPATLAAECLNEGLAQRGSEDERSLLLFQNIPRRGLELRALTSESYGRIWNFDITSRLLELEETGPWQPAPAAFDGSRGLYLGDRDMFAFLVDNDRRIFQKGPGGGLSRGFFVWNSEVGAKTFGLMTFLYEYVCGNHRVWGASNVNELTIRHIGNADARAWENLAITLKQYADSSAKGDEQKVRAARKFRIGADKDEVLDAIFGLKTGVGRKTLLDAFDKAIEHEEWYGDPRTAWGFAGGMTEIARDLPNADERLFLDRASTKVMEMAWAE